MNGRRGEKNGQGTQTHLNGSKYVGEFKDDICWNGKFIDILGNIFLERKNGEDIDVVLDKFRETVNNILEQTTKKP